MTTAEKEDLLWLILFVTVAGLVLIITVMLMMAAWRRHLGRAKSSTQENPNDEMPDAWKTSGDRLVAQISSFSTPQADDDSNDDSNNDEDDDNNDTPDGFDDLDDPGEAAI